MLDASGPHMPKRPSQRQRVRRGLESWDTVLQQTIPVCHFWPMLMTSSDFGNSSPHGKCVVGRMLDGPMPILKAPRKVPSRAADHSPDEEGRPDAGSILVVRRMVIIAARGRCAASAWVDAADVRLAPDSGAKADIAGGPRGAATGLLCSKWRW